MDLEKLQEQADKDLKINDTELDLESLKTPQLHNQYMKHLTKYKLMLSRAETEYNMMKREKWEYYTGKENKYNKKNGQRVRYGEQALRCATLRYAMLL
jgi:hypothetical protein